MERNPYIPTALAVYFNYLVQGMAIIILAQNMEFLANQYGTDKAGVAYVISAIGIGKLLVLFAAGVLSDKYGRKPFIFIAMAGFIVFFVGILFSHSVQVAFAFALILGMANSFLDAASYPALMESFPNAAGTANILVKAFVSGGQFALPLIIGFLINNNLYYGYSFIICIIILVLNGIFLIKLKFPSRVVKKVENNSAGADNKEDHAFVSKPKLAIEGVALIIIGYTATATFNLISVWIPIYGSDVVKMAKSASLSLVSYYSIGSLIAVFITSFLTKSLIRPVTFVFVYPLLSTIALFILWLVPTPTTCYIGAFAIGFTAAGGVLQLALTTMAELFPYNKGMITGVVYTASSLSFFTIPVITGILSKTSISSIILLDVGIAAVGTLLGLLVNIRYRKVINTGVKKSDALSKAI